MGRTLFTSESVTEGHPDKVCDKISDAVLDAYLAGDPESRVACETLCTAGMVLVCGEITSKASADIQSVARKTLVDIGYGSPEAGFDGNTCAVLVSTSEQSSDIALGTNDRVGGAGDQGMMFGYACDETPDLMPLPITLAHKLAYSLAVTRKEGKLPFILPDGKTQVTIAYGDMGKPEAVETIIISTQHTAKAKKRELVRGLTEFVVKPVLDSAKLYSPWLDTEHFKLFVNPTGRFVKGGPAADTGLTGRKIIVDTYGGYACHGGGAFSGKDPTKVDRSAAYAARHIAKNIVAAGVARKCQVQLAYAIGVAEPVSIRVDTFGTSPFDAGAICKAVKKTFDLTPLGIINQLDLRRPMYTGTAAYGHFGNVTGEDRPWERVNYADLLKNEIFW